MKTIPNNLRVLSESEQAQIILDWETSPAKKMLDEKQARLTEAIASKKGSYNPAV